MTRVLVLVSGGIDSPAAAYRLMKNKGCEVALVHFHNQTIQESLVKNKVVQLAQQLAHYAKNKSITLYLVPFAPIQRAIVREIPAELRMIVYRRMMFRIAQEIAKRDDYHFLATGDALGQVASQTLENFITIHAVATMPVLTPLLGEDKVVIKAVATEAGTLKISELPYEDCCSMFIAKHPATKSMHSQLFRAEAQLDTGALVDAAVKKSRTDVLNAS